MKKKTLFVCLVFFLYSPLIGFAEQNPIEIFDIEEGRVIQETPTSKGIQKETEKVLSSITGVYKNLDPLPKKGTMIKIPLDPPVMVKNDWFHDLVNEAVLIFSSEETEPYILIWDDENLPHFYTFDFSTQNLMKMMKFHSNSTKH